MGRLSIEVEAMTTKEAIKQLESLRAHCMSMIVDDSFYDKIWEKDCEALEMAIKALRGKEQEGHHDE